MVIYSNLFLELHTTRVTSGRGIWVKTETLRNNTKEGLALNINFYYKTLSRSTFYFLTNKANKLNSSHYITVKLKNVKFPSYPTCVVRCGMTFLVIPIVTNLKDTHLPHIWHVIQPSFDTECKP